MPNLVNVVKKRNWILGNRVDPYLTFNFIVEIDGVAVAGFNDVSGLSVETQVERKTFGGENHREHTFIVQTKYSDITLKQGMTNDNYMWEWYRDVISGPPIERRNGSIYLLDHAGNPKVWWDFWEACPIKWEGPTFNAASSAVAVETLVLTHNGLYMHK